jgi:hypothetical protein
MSNSQLYHDENKNSASSLKQQPMGRHVAPFEHINMFRANQYLLFLLTTACVTI